MEDSAVWKMVKPLVIPAIAGAFTLGGVVAVNQVQNSARDQTVQDQGKRVDQVTADTKALTASQAKNEWQINSNSSAIIALQSDQKSTQTAIGQINANMARIDAKLDIVVDAIKRQDK